MRPLTTRSRSKQGGVLDAVRQSKRARPDMRTFAAGIFFVRANPRVPPPAASMKSPQRPLVLPRVDIRQNGREKPMGVDKDTHDLRWVRTPTNRMGGRQADKTDNGSGWGGSGRAILPFPFMWMDAAEGSSGRPISAWVEE